INLLQSQAAVGNCDLVVRGLFNGSPRGFLYTPQNGSYQTDKQGEASVSLASLLQAAGTRAELTFTGVPVLAGRRNAIDRDGNGTLNRDEPLTPNALDTAQYFVWQHYRDFLSRDPDTGGLDYWTAQITNCGSDPACIHSQRIGVSAAFFIELEFQETGYVVYRMYRGAYGSRVNAPSRANVLFAQFIADRWWGWPAAEHDQLCQHFCRKAGVHNSLPDGLNADRIRHQLVRQSKFGWGRVCDAETSCD